MNDAQKRALGLVARYRRLPKQVAEILGVGGTLAGLLERGLLQQHPLPGNLVAFGITEASARFLSLPPKRAESLGEAALDCSIAALWFCHLNGRRRVRVEYSELRPLLGAEPPKGLVLCLDDAPRPCLYRVYVPGANTSIRDIARQLEKALQASRVSALAPWLEDGLYGVAVLASEEGRLPRIHEAAAQHAKHIPIIIEYAPDALGLAEALRRRRQHEGKG